MDRVEEAYVLNRNLRKEKSYAILVFLICTVYILRNCELDFVSKICVHNLGNLLLKALSLIAEK